MAYARDSKSRSRKGLRVRLPSPAPNTYYHHMSSSGRALLFDLDGVLSDTQSLHAEVESTVLARHGITIEPQEISRRFSGVKNEEWFSTLADEHGQPLDIQHAITEKWEEFLRQLPRRADAIPGGRELLLSGARHGWSIAVVSASRHTAVETILKLLGIDHYVQIIIGADDVRRGKPDPEGYLAAAEHLGVRPNRCIVIEDGLAGVCAAKAAGMHTLGLGPHARQDLQQQPDIITESLTTIVINDLEHLVDAASAETADLPK